MRDPKETAPAEDTLDRVLQDCLPETPPDDVAESVTPWRRAMDRALVGLALNAVTLRFLALDYLLPAVGLVLLLLGFRALRRDNRWFRVCYAVAVFKAAWFFPSLVLNAVAVPPPAAVSAALSALSTASLALTVVQLFCLWQGLRAVKARAGLPAEAPEAAALMIWNLVILALALGKAGGTLTGILLITAYVLILRSLFRLSSELDEAGYAVRPAPVRLSDRALGRWIAGLLAAGLLAGYLFGAKYPMDWAPAAPDASTETAELRAELLALGFPEEVLADLAEEDVAACRGALRVVADSVDRPVNPGREVVEKEAGSEFHYTVYDEKELRLTSVAVELPGERETWRVLHHFRWLTDSGFPGTESLQLWGADRRPEGWVRTGEITGRVLYTRDGVSYAAPYASLDDETYTAASFFLGEQTVTDTFASFSLPGRGEDQRGYVAYTVTARPAAVQYMINSWVNYIHQRGWWQYPVKTAAEYRMSGARGRADPFVLVQAALQFYNLGDTIDVIRGE